MLWFAMLYLRLSCDDPTSNGSLHSDLKHLPRDGVLEALTHGFAWAVRTVSAEQKVLIRNNRWSIWNGLL